MDDFLGVEDMCRDVIYVIVVRGGVKQWSVKQGHREMERGISDERQAQRVYSKMEAHKFSKLVCVRITKHNVARDREGAARMVVLHGDSVDRTRECT